MRNTIRRSIKFIKIAKKIPDIYWINKILEFNLELSQFFWEKDNSSLLIKDLDLKLPKSNCFDFFLRAMPYAKALKKSVGATFHILSDEMYVELQGIKINVQTWEEFYILNEIFIEGVYNVCLTRPTIFIDIGMNTGFSSLFLAQKPNVLAVLGYEPIKKTFEQAMYNLTLNPELSKKIKTYNFGLGKSTECVLVDYNYSNKGSIGINGIPPWVALTSRERVEQVELPIVQANQIIDSCTSEYANVDIIAKIDCEGSEYDILESLVLHNSIKHIKGLLIEWHNACKNDELIQRLVGSGFEVIYLNPASSTIGMIYAFQSKN